MIIITAKARARVAVAEIRTAMVAAIRIALWCPGAMASSIVQPLKWHGGKNYLARHIVALMPRHVHYCESFFGGGAVLKNLTALNVGERNAQFVLDFLCVEGIPVASQDLLDRFQVKLAWRKAVWRRIELTGDQTLDDLHEAIQRAFGWDNDHLYAFFLSGRAWDRQTEYESPFGEIGRNAAHYRLEQLPIAPGQQFLYLFDFGDELRHLVKLEAVIPGGAEQGVRYPQITERQGQAPSQ